MNKFKKLIETWLLQARTRCVVDIQCKCTFGKWNFCVSISKNQAKEKVYQHQQQQWQAQNAASAIYVCGIAWAWAISPRRAYGLIYWPLLELALFSLLEHSRTVWCSAQVVHALHCHHHLWRHQFRAVQQPVAHHSGQVRMDFTAAGLKAHDEVKRRRGCPPADATRDPMYAKWQQKTTQRFWAPFKMCLFKLAMSKYSCYCVYLWLFPLLFS